MPPFETWTRYLPAPLRDRLEGRPNLWRILTNIGWLFGDRILRMGVGLLIGVWIARYLGPEQFGLFSYAAAYVGLFTPFAVLGFEQIVVRDLVQDPAGKYQTIGTAFWLKLLAGMLAYVAALLVILFLKPESYLLHTLIALAGISLIFQAFDTIDFWFQSQVRSKFPVVARNASFLVVSTVRLALILIGAPLVAFAGAAGLEMLLTAIGLVLVYRLSGERLGHWRINLSRAVSLLRASWPLLFSSLAIVVYMKIDQIMLGEMLNDQAVGIYAAAVRISEVWYFIPTAVVASVAPTIINAKKTDAALYARRTQQLLNTMAMLGYGVAIPVTVLASPLIWLLYGADYAGAGPTLAVHIWAGLFVCLGVAQGPWLINEGRTGYLLLTTAIGAVLNVALNLVLIPDYASLGAAIATLVSYGITVAVVGLFYGPARPAARMTLRALTFRS